MVEATYEPGVTVSLVARRNCIQPNQLFAWRKLATQGALTATSAREEVVAASEYRAVQSQIRELQRLLGKNTMEAEILREALMSPPPKSVPYACCRGPREVPGERRVRDAGRGPVERRGFDEERDRRFPGSSGPPART